MDQEFTPEEFRILRKIAHQVTTDEDRLDEILTTIGRLSDNSQTLLMLIQERDDEMRARARLRDRLRGIGLWGGLIGTIIAGMALARELRALWHGWPPP